MLDGSHILRIFRLHGWRMPVRRMMVPDAEKEETNCER